MRWKVKKVEKGKEVEVAHKMKGAEGGEGEGSGM